MAENVIRSAVWHSQLDAKGVTDHITVRNLQATVSAGVDVWNRNKSQQALITTTIYLRKPFDSAARGDTLDNSTVHYGKLSKTIKAGIENKAGTKIGHFYTHELALAIISFVDDMTSIEVMAATEVDVFYPKGSMLGDGAGYVHSVMQDGEPFSRVLYLRNVRVPCIIGVNSNERLQKQPVVINIWIECLRGDRTDDYPKLEAVVVQASTGSHRYLAQSNSCRRFRNPRLKPWSPYQPWLLTS